MSRFFVLLTSPLFFPTKKTVESVSSLINLLNFLCRWPHLTPGDEEGVEEYQTWVKERVAEVSFSVVLNSPRQFFGQKGNSFGAFFVKDNATQSYCKSFLRFPTVRGIVATQLNDLYSILTNTSSKTGWLPL